MTELGASHSESPPVLTPGRLRRTAEMLETIDPAFSAYLRSVVDSAQLSPDEDIVVPNGLETRDRSREVALSDPGVASGIDRVVREVHLDVIASADRDIASATSRDAEPDPTA
ncbi:hypothetical protein FOV72_20880 [Gordonia rubripertincta]|uniref:hypothetical protein n=1 Tax=Gordonia rubripertincta TaxID=36822 RepID=UPI001180D1C3|nr:hypothetical protein [Gordonia rubripertincta]TSD93106.1 hypothetical protein FOV72_20880 [Gordonia rubripertincta]